MKRVVESSSVWLPPVRMYLEDLEYLIEALSKDSTVELEHRKFSYDSLAELKANIQRDSLDSLSLTSAPNSDSAEWCYVTINIRPGEVIVYGSAGAPERRAHVTELLRAKVPWYSWGSDTFWWFALHGSLATAAPLIMAAALILALELDVAAAFVVAVLIYGAASFLLFGGRIRIGGSRIFLYKSFAKPTFWERNSDKILASVASSVISAAIGFVAGYLWRGH